MCLFWSDRTPQPRRPVALQDDVVQEMGAVVRAPGLGNRSAAGGGYGLVSDSFSDVSQASVNAR